VSIVLLGGRLYPVSFVIGESACVVPRALTTGLIFLLVKLTAAAAQKDLPPHSVCHLLSPELPLAVGPQTVPMWPDTRHYNGPESEVRSAGRSISARRGSKIVALKQVRYSSSLQ
jgi:hypothetical protein